MVKPSGNSIHVPLHADGIGTVQFDVQRTGVVHHLLRSAGTAQHMQAGDHTGGQAITSCAREQSYFSVRSPHFASMSSACARRAGWKLGLELRVLPSG